MISEKFLPLFESHLYLFLVVRLFLWNEMLLQQEQRKLQDHMEDVRKQFLIISPEQASFPQDVVRPLNLGKQRSRLGRHYALEGGLQ